MSLNTILEILGALVGLIFIYINVRARQSLVGSFFKKYYYWVMIGSIFLFLGFTTDITGEFFGMSENLADVVHHLELLIFGSIFICAARTLPKEAAEHIKL